MASRLAGRRRTLEDVARPLLAVAVVVALTATAAPARASEPSTVDTWTIPGCVLQLTNTYVAAHKHHPAHWHTDGTVTCTGSQLDTEARIDLTRNGTSVPSSFARLACTVTALELCDVVDVSHDTKYYGPRANWRARLVVFLRGPLSLAAAAASAECVVDIPSFETICTFVGRATKR